MKVSRFALLAVLLCLATQTVNSRTPKFQTFVGGSTTQCPQGQVCNGLNTTTNGNNTSSCPVGQICNGGNTGTNTTGGNTTCPIGQVCNGGNTMGGNTTTGGNTTNTNNCPAGQTCTVTCPAGQICGTVTGGATYTKGTVQTFNQTVLTGYNQSTDNTTRIDPKEAERNAQQILKSVSAVGKVNITFTGPSGLVQIGLDSNASSPANGSSGGNTTSQYMAVKLRKAEDSNGQCAENFDNATWTWAGPTATTCQGVPCNVLTATANLSVKTVNGTRVSAGFACQVQLFNASGFITYGALNSSVDPSCIKFSYNVTNWPFSSLNSSFYMALTLASGEQQFNATADNSALKVGNGLFSTPSFAYLDGSSKPSAVDVLYGVDSQDSNGTQGFVVFKFPQFNGSLYYDPIAYSSSTTAVVSTTIVGTGDNTNTTTSTTAPTSAPTKKSARSSTFSATAAFVSVLLLVGLFL